MKGRGREGRGGKREMGKYVGDGSEGRERRGKKGTKGEKGRYGGGEERREEQVGKRGIEKGRAGWRYKL